MSNMRENFDDAIINHTYRLADCNIKKTTDICKDENGVSTKYRSVMFGRTVMGTEAVKDIVIDEETHRTYETVLARNNSGQYYSFKDCNLTGWRCSEMTLLAVEMMHHKPNKVGFIGTGKTNLLNCIAIVKKYGIREVVIRGSARNYAKNAGDFMTVCDSVLVDSSKDLRLLNECDLIIECTSNNQREAQISTGQLNKPRLIIALNSGYLLDESFRKEYESYSDWPEQLYAHYESEFIFDGGKQYKLKQLSYDHEPYERAVVYLYGVGIADAVAAEQLIEWLEENGMEKPFII